MALVTSQCFLHPLIAISSPTAALQPEYINPAQRCALHAILMPFWFPRILTNKSNQTYSSVAPVVREPHSAAPAPLHTTEKCNFLIQCRFRQANESNNQLPQAGNRGPDSERFYTSVTPLPSMELLCFTLTSDQLRLTGRSRPGSMSFETCCATSVTPKQIWLCFTPTKHSGVLNGTLHWL